jgi:hypothetical protein
MLHGRRGEIKILAFSDKLNLIIKLLVDKYIINNNYFVKLVLSASILNKQKRNLQI